MAKETGRTESGQGGYVCPVCKRPVETVLRRRKVQGIYAPFWGPGPCHEPDCKAHVDEEQPETHPVRHSHHRGST